MKLGPPKRAALKAPGAIKTTTKSIDLMDALKTALATPTKTAAEVIHENADKATKFVAQIEIEGHRIINPVVVSTKTAPLAGPGIVESKVEFIPIAIPANIPQPTPKATKTKPEPAPPREVIAVRMSKALAAAIRGRFIVEIQIFEGAPTVPGSRLFLREWAGAATGRADLVTVVAASDATLIVERRWCWGSGKLDDDLTQLGLTIMPDVFPMVGF